MKILRGITADGTAWRANETFIPKAWWIRLWRYDRFFELPQSCCPARRLMRLMTNARKSKKLWRRMCFLYWDIGVWGWRGLSFVQGCTCPSLQEVQLPLHAGLWEERSKGFSLLDGKHTTRSRDLILRCDSEISNSYPLVNKHSNGKSPSWIGNTSSKGGCSIAMLDYRRVFSRFLWWFLLIHFSAH